MIFTIMRSFLLYISVELSLNDYSLTLPLCSVVTIKSFRIKLLYLKSQFEFILYLNWIKAIIFDKNVTNEFKELINKAVKSINNGISFGLNKWAVEVDTIQVRNFIMSIYLNIIFAF